ncbi:hypothetical protein U27_02329 [Candidatus Vecturithrix granuli]|uniref:Uncharacterized protein n=1 Tax=Vecturithrix granuli TaxID=1499967 RepID=A0A0S6W752_VECG1|nr:hypothetical protein U27_02329 [Candidatus Vecturithrix granuli]
MNGRSPGAMKIQCSAKLQFRGGQQCAKLEFRATFSGEMTTCYNYTMLTQIF